MVAPPVVQFCFCPGTPACAYAWSCSANAAPMCRGCGRGCGRCPPGSGVNSDLFCFLFRKRSQGGVGYWQLNCKYKQHLVLHAGLFFVWHYAGHLLQQLQQIPEVAMMIFLVCCRHWLAGCGSFGLIWGCSQVYIRVVLSAFGIPVPSPVVTCAVFCDVDHSWPQAHSCSGD